MKVLHLPANIASHPSETALGLRSIGVECRVLLIASSNGKNNPTDAILMKSPFYFKRRNPLFILHFIYDIYLLIKNLLWADVIHWYYDTTLLPFKADLLLVKMLKKNAFIEWAGSDIRIPEVEFKDNPYYTKHYQNERDWEYKGEESKEKSIANQRRFKRAGFAPLVLAGMEQYIQKDIFPVIYKTRIRINIDKFVPEYPDPTNQIPVIVHMPSKTGAKGTQYVIDAIKKLKENYPLEFILIHNKTREEVFEAIKKADIVLDQFVGGHHGMAAVEAMALGKPTFCYIKPAGRCDYPTELPLVMSEARTLENDLEKYLIDGELRHRIGKAGRAYVEKYHDTFVLAIDLKKIYSIQLNK